MGDKSKIEWTEATWNPVTGCTKVSQGCKHCYAKFQAWPRLKASRGTVYYGREFEDVRCHPERLDQPLRWRRPRRIFVNSMSDLFHADVPDQFIDQVFAVMALAPQHTFQILTKRSLRLRGYFRNIGSTSRRDWVASQICRLKDTTRIPPFAWPLPNVWLGVSVEDQAEADERIPLLLETPAAVRWISAEPLLGPIDLRDPPNDIGEPRLSYLRNDEAWPQERIDWVVVGGESGPKARPMHPNWARSLRDQCRAAQVPFFFKQWGEWFPGSTDFDGNRIVAVPDVDHDPSAGQWEGRWDFHSWIQGDDCDGMLRVGKHRAGRLLDGRTWDEYPKRAVDLQGEAA